MLATELITTNKVSLPADPARLVRQTGPGRLCRAALAGPMAGRRPLACRTEDAL